MFSCRKLDPLTRHQLLQGDGSDGSDGWGAGAVGDPMAQWPRQVLGIDEYATQEEVKKVSGIFTWGPPALGR